MFTVSRVWQDIFGVCCMLNGRVFCYFFGNNCFCAWFNINRWAFLNVSHPLFFVRSVLLSLTVTTSYLTNDCVSYLQFCVKFSQRSSSYLSLCCPEWITSHTRLTTTCDPCKCHFENVTWLLPLPANSSASDLAVMLAFCLTHLCMIVIIFMFQL